MHALHRIFQSPGRNIPGTTSTRIVSNKYILGPHESSVFLVEVKNQAGGPGPIPIVAAAASVA